MWDYNEANIGDCFVMMRVGEYKPGIVFYGTFVSDPYADEDWAGTDKKRRYVLMDCFGFKKEDEPIITAEEIGRMIPGIEWMNGHSGEVLSEATTEQVVLMLENRIREFSFTPDAIPDEDESISSSGKLQELMDKFAELSPSIHSRNEEDYDWLESDEDCRRW